MGAETTTMRDAFESILHGYEKARASEPFAGSNDTSRAFKRLEEDFRRHRAVASRPTMRVKASLGQGNWAKVPWIAFLDERNTATTQHGVYCVYLFRQDMSGVYITFNQGVTEPKNKLGMNAAREFLRKRAAEIRACCSGLTRFGFVLDDEIDLRADTGLGADYEVSTIAYKLYERGNVPDDVALLGDLESVLAAYDSYLDHDSPRIDTRAKSNAVDSEVLVRAVTDDIERRHFVFEPWQVAAYVAAVRTKPFVILAGISGTGKSKLPGLVADSTGSVSKLVPVRPDWTDSSDVLGFTDLQGIFRPGVVLELAREAQLNPQQELFCVMDEMNLARVELYFAEVLSRIEDRHPAAGGGFESDPLLMQPAQGGSSDWEKVCLPSNLALVGTVNMDESSHGFSRKVLDRAFTLEFSNIDLTEWEVDESKSRETTSAVEAWPVTEWFPRAITLGGVKMLTEEERELIQRTITALSEVNRFLGQAQLQVGYRTRDEVALFVLHANELTSCFVTRSGRPVEPFDLALHMKVLPRIIGGSGAIRQTLLQFLGWAWSGKPLEVEEEARPILDEWERLGRGSEVAVAKLPHSAARLALMWERLLTDGFTSFWL